MNLFLRTRSLTSSKEDHLTEFFAALLYYNTKIRDSYAQIILNEHADKNGWISPVISKIKTQVSFPESNSRPDMLLELSDGHVIICEHKLEAIETPGSVTDDRYQLERYLSLPVDGLVYVRANWKPPSTDIINHPKYIAQSSREHFLWRDFYPLLTDQDDFLTTTMKSAFEFLGFNPPHPFIGELYNAPDGSNDDNRRNFAKLWSKTRSFASQLGWRVSAGNIVELYLSDSPSKLTSNVYISPHMPNRFLMRFTPYPGKTKTLYDKIEDRLSASHWTTEIGISNVKRAKGKLEVVDLTTSLEEVIGKVTSDAKQIEDSLYSFVSYFLRLI